MSGLLDGLENVLGVALGPLEEADKLLGDAISKLGEGVEFAGEEAEKFGAFISSLEGKIAALRAKLSG